MFCVSHWDFDGPGKEKSLNGTDKSRNSKSWFSQTTAVVATFRKKIRLLHVSLVPLVFIFSSRHLWALRQSKTNSVFMFSFKSLCFRLYFYARCIDINLVSSVGFQCWKVNVKFFWKTCAFFEYPKILGRKTEKTRWAGSKERSMNCFVDMDTTDTVNEKNYIHMHVYAVIIKPSSPPIA